jgi:hypothetical protein
VRAHIALPISGVGYDGLFHSLIDTTDSVSVSVGLDGTDTVYFVAVGVRVLSHPNEKLGAID